MAMADPFAALSIVRLSDLLFVFGSQRQKPLHRRVITKLFGKAIAWTLPTAEVVPLLVANGQSFLAGLSRIRRRLQVSARSMCVNAAEIVHTEV
jgi:hypothetical protein